MDVLDLENRWKGKTDGCGGRFRVWTDSKQFLMVKREWLQTADGAANGPRVLVAFDAEDTLQGEEARARRATPKRGQRTASPSVVPDSDAKAPSVSELDAMLADITGESQEAMDISTELFPAEVDRLFGNAAFLKMASEQGAFLIAVTEKPMAFRDSVVSPDGFGRFLIFSTARELSRLDNSLAENMGYYTESPGEPLQYFLPFAGDGIAKAVLKAAKPQKGADKA